MSEKSNLSAVLGIKSCNSKMIKKYRILEESTGKIQDVSVETIKAALGKGTTINGLQIKEDKYGIERLVETTPIKSIPELKQGSISLEQWCKENGQRGQRIIQEFNEGNNSPITAKDISYGGGLKLGFRCMNCKKINIQQVDSKTGEKADNKCKYCSNRGEEKAYSLLNWCNDNGTKGQRILQEYIQGGNSLSPDKIAYSCNKKANFKCLKCGNINEQQICSKTAKQERGCKHCCKTTTSFAEQLIYKFLQINNLEVYNRYKIHDKEFDIYIPSLNLLIEHQSSLHAQIDKEVHDQFGGYEAQSLGLNLLEICCLDNKYQRQPTTSCIVYKQNHEQEMIQDLAAWLYQNYGIQLNMNLYTRQLEDEAYLNSIEVPYEKSLQARRPDLALEWNQQLNGKITPNKVAASSSRKYYWTCKVCRHVWLGAPNWRNSKGTGCPNYRQHKHFQ